MKTKETLAGFLVQSYAKANNLSGSFRFAKRFGFKPNTVNGWWHGTHPPRSKKERQKLYRLIPHPALSGSLTDEKRRRLLGPSNAEDRAFVAKFSKLEPAPETPVPTKTNPVIERFAHLVQALLPDLQSLIRTDGETRRLAKRCLGSTDFIDFYNCVRALSSDEMYQALERDHILDKLKGGE